MANKFSFSYTMSDPIVTIAQDDAEGFKQLGVDVNAPLDEKGVTPLMYASAQGAGHVVDYLLKSGANVNATDKSGMTALMHAADTFGPYNADGWARVEDFEDDVGPKAYAIEQLLKKGADTSMKDKEGRTALDHVPGSSDESKLVDEIKAKLKPKTGGKKKRRQTKKKRQTKKRRSGTKRHL